MITSMLLILIYNGTRIRPSLMHFYAVCEVLGAMLAEATGMSRSGIRTWHAMMLRDKLYFLPYARIERGYTRWAATSFEWSYNPISRVK